MTIHVFMCILCVVYVFCVYNVDGIENTKRVRAGRCRRCDDGDVDDDDGGRREKRLSLSTRFLFTLWNACHTRVCACVYVHIYAPVCCCECINIAPAVGNCWR